MDRQSSTVITFVAKHKELAQRLRAITNYPVRPSHPHYGGTPIHNAHEEQAYYVMPRELEKQAFPAVIKDIAATGIGIEAMAQAVGFGPEKITAWLEGREIPEKIDHRINAFLAMANILENFSVQSEKAKVQPAPDSMPGLK